MIVNNFLVRPYRPDSHKRATQKTGTVQINLHHVLGQESGAMVELQASTHQKF
ncbi:HNH/ENDO VII family nuclease [Undibacterium luofuense]|uniref:HNH/ENDO VII family nuclease n=1 Tax=Undibacterium luofuense TaxID=2828733 RepID=UPI003C6F3E53